VKTLLVSAVLLIVLLVSATVLSGYGNPLRAVSYAAADGTPLEGKAFYIGACSKGICEFKQNHQKVLLFSQGDGVQGYPGSIRGVGREPLTILQKYRRRLFRDPNLLLEAVKSCSHSHIHVQYQWHGQAIIIPSTSDNFAIAKCVKSDLYGSFSVGVDGPQASRPENDQFKSLETPE
jgi:hypothetical protein